MPLLESLLEESNANRIIDLERVEAGGRLKGDFEGSVAGIWVGLDESGAGIVSYNDKEYYVRRLGFTSISAGTVVELSFGDGTYYASW